jgi:rhodanese-related sulfurtransferase
MPRWRSHHRRNNIIGLFGRLAFVGLTLDVAVVLILACRAGSLSTCRRRASRRRRKGLWSRDLTTEVDRRQERRHRKLSPGQSEAPPETCKNRPAVESPSSIETGTVTPEPGNVTVLHDDLYASGRPALTAQEAGAAGVTLLDARAPERFSGDVEPVDPVGGHIPGARNVPSTTVLTDDGTFLADGALTKLFSDRGADGTGRVGVYCGSGITAAVTLAALAVVGRDAALFPGSWSEWSSDPARAVGRGPA